MDQAVFSFYRVGVKCAVMLVMDPGSLGFNTEFTVQQMQSCSFP
jgi:hypothetical protein